MLTEKESCADTSLSLSVSNTVVKVMFFMLEINKHHCSTHSLEGDVHGESIKQKKQKKTLAKWNCHCFIYGLLLSSVAITCMNISCQLIYILVCD